MIENSVLAVLALLEAADPGDWSRLLASHREPLARVARSAPRLPDRLIEHAFDARDPELLKAIASNRRLVADPAFRARLAALGIAGIIVAALDWRSHAYGDQDGWTTAEIRAMLARPEAGDPMWSDPDLARTLLSTLENSRRSVLVACRAPGAAAKAYGRTYRELLADRLRALVSTAEADGLDAVENLLATDDTPEVPRPLDLATLRAAAERAESTEGLLPELDAGVTGSVSQRASVDWTVLAAAHGRKRFRKDIVSALTARADCTAEAAKALGDIGRVAELGDHGWILDHARPAKNALKALRGNESERLREVVADVLGDDPGAWRMVRAEIPRFKGTVAELLALVAERKAAGRLPARPTPADVAPPEPGGRLGLKIPDAAYLALLDAAAPEVRLTLLPDLDGQAAHALLTQGEHRPEWTAHLIAHGDHTLLTCLADDRRLPADQVAALMALDIPEVSHALGARHRDWPPRLAVTCPDTALRKVILGKVHVRGETPRLRLILDQWERHGREEIPAMIEIDVAQSGLPAFTAAIRKRVTALLDDPDETAALAALRAQVADGESPAGQIALLRKASRGKFKPAAIEHRSWHWPELLAEHEREPFTDQTLWTLAQQDGCPEELREIAAGLIHHWESEPEAALAEGKTPAAVLAEHKVESANEFWVRRLFRSGHLTWPDVFAHARPAEAALALVEYAAEPAKAREELAGLVTANLGDSPDVWQLTLAMLPDFAGSPAELLRTASLTMHGTAA
ncbi:hypothetical protein AB0I28_15125 [Phytomonospora sp. NPDC050363]|uniref:hypothetical protein n=1 Tax=Phytomonospora sp. NPDC050363 TaxID=3155642 RepID=UPI0033C94426